MSTSIYYSAMADSAAASNGSSARMAVHPNKAGYDVMGPLAEKAIGKALSAK